MVSEFLDIDLESDFTNLDKLDRMSKKAVVSLEKQRKALEKARKQQEIGGGIFGQAALPQGGRAPSDLAPLSKQDKKTEKKIARIMEKVRKQQVKQLGKKQGFLGQLFGGKSAKNLFDIGRNPVQFMSSIMKSIKILGPILSAVAIATFILDELIKTDKFLKKFIDVADARINKFRTLQDQANVQAGLEQRIYTTASGTLDPRESSNTFEIFNRNQGEAETQYAAQNISGVE